MIKIPNNQGLRFLMVGAVGFVIDAGVMGSLAHLADISPLWARGISFPLALSVTWALNRNWTFREGRARRPSLQYAIYLLVQLAGLAINYGIFAALVMSDSYWDARPVLALTIGAAAAVVVTFVLSRTLAFAAPKVDKPGTKPLQRAE